MSSTRPRTIQIFLQSGDPAGIRIAEQTTSIIRLIEVPRSQIADFLKMPEARQVALYFLFSRDHKNELYIGQTGEVGTRLQSHDKNLNRDWDRALIMVSLTNNLTQTHVLYMESVSIEKAKSCGRYEVINANGGQRPHTPIPLKVDCDEMHEIGALLLATLGYPVFESLRKAGADEENERVYCKRSGVDAYGYYTNEGLVVLKGSSAPHNTARQTDPRIVQKRDELLKGGILVQQDDRVVFSRDHLFPSPSGASCLLLLSASNGWTDWKTKDGQTLHDYHGRNIANTLPQGEQG